MTRGEVIVITTDDALHQHFAQSGPVIRFTAESITENDWGAARLLLVGDDQSAALAERRLPRRDSTLVVGTDLDDAGIWMRAVKIGAEHVVFLPDGERWLLNRITATVSLVADSMGVASEEDEPNTVQDYSHLHDPAEREWLTNVDPAAVLTNAHRIYEFMNEGGLPADSYTRELAFTKASKALGIDYDVLYNAWLDVIPVQDSSDGQESKA